MALFLRLANNKFRNQMLIQNRSGLMKFVRPLTLQPKTVQPPKDESHDARNMRLKRPQSPHLTIYAPQLTTLLSISHRMTGMVLSAYVIGFGLAAVVLPESIPHYIESLECAEIGAGLIVFLKFMLAFPMTYHFWNGIRHLLWDTGNFLSIKEVYLTGYIMLLLAISSGVILSLM